MKVKLQAVYGMQILANMKNGTRDIFLLQRLDIQLLQDEMFYL